METERALRREVWTGTVLWLTAGIWIALHRRTPATTASDIWVIVAALGVILFGRAFIMLKLRSGNAN